METVRFRIFSVSREIQVARNRNSFLKAEFDCLYHNSTITASGTLVLHSYHSKFAERRQRLRTFSKRISVTLIEQNVSKDFLIQFHSVGCGQRGPLNQSEYTASGSQRETSAFFAALDTADPSASQKAWCRNENDAEGYLQLNLGKTMLC